MFEIKVGSLLVFFI